MSQKVVGTIGPLEPGKPLVVTIGEAKSADGRIRFRVHVPLVQAGRLLDALRGVDISNPKKIVRYLDQVDITVDIDTVENGATFRHSIRTKLVEAGVFGALQRSIESGMTGLIQNRFKQLCDEADKGGTPIHGKAD